MRTRNTQGLFVFFMAFSLIASGAYAKTNKYNRNSTPATTDDGTANPSATPSAKATPAPSPGGEKKVDLTDLENRYWTAKDTEFSVVQNRLYTKAKRFSITPAFGPLLTDPYTNSYNFGVALNYYFSERSGVEIQGWKTSAADANFIKTFHSLGATPDRNIPQGYIGASYNWIPIYAKLSLLEKKILYFDMSVSPGIGVSTMQADTFVTPPNPAPQSVSQAPITFALDVAQQIFLSEHWAIRLDLRNHVYQETIYGASSGANLRTQSTYYGTFMLGVTFFQ